MQADVNFLGCQAHWVIFASRNGHAKGAREMYFSPSVTPTIQLFLISHPDRGAIEVFQRCRAQACIRIRTANRELERIHRDGSQTRRLHASHALGQAARPLTSLQPSQTHSLRRRMPPSEPRATCDWCVGTDTAWKRAKRVHPAARCLRGASFASRLS